MEGLLRIILVSGLYKGIIIFTVDWTLEKKTCFTYPFFVIDKLCFNEVILKLCHIG